MIYFTGLPSHEDIKDKITEYFKEDGHSRIPMDYAERWFKAHFDLRDRAIIKFKISNFKIVENVAKEVMGWTVNP